MDVFDYFDRRRREFDEVSVDGRDVDFFAERWSDDMRGRIVGQVYLADDVYLKIHERVEAVGNRVHRTDYAYFLIVEGVEYWGYEERPDA